MLPLLPHDHHIKQGITAGRAATASEEFLGNPKTLTNDNKDTTRNSLVFTAVANSVIHGK